MDGVPNRVTQCNAIIVALTESATTLNSDLVSCPAVYGPPGGAKERERFSPETVSAPGKVKNFVAKTGRAKCLSKIVSIAEGNEPRGSSDGRPGLT